MKNTGKTSAMKWSLNLGKISGIRLSIHWTFFILLVWIFLSYNKEHGQQEAFMGVVYILSLFICVTLHELGHALTAKRFGITTRSITLLPIGGLAQMEKMPKKPKQELLVAIAGPLVNLVIAGILYVYLSATNSFPELSDLENFTLTEGGLWFGLFAANLVLMLFNLVPAFPMDGGRVLRALLAMRYPRNKATSIAAGIGQILAIAFVFLGFYGNIWLVLIGVFIYLGAGAEASFENTKSTLSGHTVRDVVMTQYSTLHPKDTLQAATEKLLDSSDHEFLVMENGAAVGILTKKRIISGLTEHGSQSSVEQSMLRKFPGFTTNTPLQTAYQDLMLNDRPLAIVMDNNEIIGVVTLENINEFILVEGVLNKA